MFARQPELKPNSQEYNEALAKLRQLRDSCLKMIDKVKSDKDEVWERRLNVILQVMDGQR